jgi:hypothetical protein
MCHNDVVKDICEIISFSLIIVQLFFIITNWTQKIQKHFF